MSTYPDRILDAGWAWRPTGVPFDGLITCRREHRHSILPHSAFTGTPEAGLDCGCGFYLSDITSWNGAGPTADPDTRNDLRE